MLRLNFDELADNFEDARRKAFSKLKEIEYLPENYARFMICIQVNIKSIEEIEKGVWLERPNMPDKNLKRTIEFKFTKSEDGTKWGLYETTEKP